MSMKDEVADAAQAVADKAKDVGHQFADGASQAACYVKETTGLGDSCGTSKGVADIRPHMAVISSCGCTIGKVDHVEGGAIKLTRNDSPDGQHHYVPAGWVDHVDSHVQLNKNATDAKRDWKADAASAGA